jgi:5-methylcytosine-specific restriction protein A
VPKKPASFRVAPKTPAPVRPKRSTAGHPGHTARWQKCRAIFLRANPLCVACMPRGRLTPASVVDHVTPHKGDGRLFWDESNWQALCKPCHDAKTAKTDGGFGRPTRPKG